jgi:hypothetical protein
MEGMIPGKECDVMHCLLDCVLLSYEVQEDSGLGYKNLMGKLYNSEMSEGEYECIKAANTQAALSCRKAADYFGMFR